MAAANPTRYTVRYNNLTENIEILTPQDGVIQSAPINEFLIFEKPLQNLGDYPGNFTWSQKVLRMLDIFKDAKKMKGGKEINAEKLQSLLGSLPGYDDIDIPNTHGNASTRLTDIKTTFLNEMKHKYTRKGMIKINDQYQYVVNLAPRTVFQESGIRPDRLINNPTFCRNIANEIIDPLPRTVVPGTHQSLFPAINRSLVLDNTFLELFGIPESSLVNTRLVGGDHMYILDIDGNEISENAPNLQLENPSKTVGYFDGNQKKNNFIQENYNEDATDSIANNLKKKKMVALLLSKELGDLLQVLIAFIYNMLNPDILYTLVTCDMIVMMQCLIMNMKCITTGHFGDEGDPSNKRYSTFIVENDNNLTRYQHTLIEINSIIEYNNAIIEGLDTINRVQFGPLPNGTISGSGGDIVDVAYEIYQGQHNRPFYISLDFLRDMKRDMNRIQAAATHTRNLLPSPQQGGVQPGGEKEPQDKIYQESLLNALEAFDRDYTIIPPFRERGGRINLCSQVRPYTEARHNWNFCLRGHADNKYIDIIKLYIENSSIYYQFTGTGRVLLPPKIREIILEYTAPVEDINGCTALPAPAVIISGGMHGSQAASRTSKKKATNVSRRSPFLYDFYPIPFTYTEGPTRELGEKIDGLGEEIDEYVDSKINSGESVKDIILERDERGKVVADIHALLRRQIIDYFTKHRDLIRYGDDILTYLYHDFRIKRHTQFGSALEKKLNTIVQTRILPVQNPPSLSLKSPPRNRIIGTKRRGNRGRSFTNNNNNNRNNSNTNNTKKRKLMQKKPQMQTPTQTQKQKQKQKSHIYQTPPRNHKTKGTQKRGLSKGNYRTPMNTTPNRWSPPRAPLPISV